MDESAIREWLDEFVDNFKEHVLRYAIFSITGLAAFGWVWSFLFNVLSQSNGSSMPWTALRMLLDSSQNTTKENTLLWLSLFIPSVTLSIFVAANFKDKYIKSIYGDAHLATMREVKKMGLLDTKNGLIIGDMRRRLLRAALISHALIFAPSRSGKGVSQVIPNVLTYDESILCIDLKEEIFEATSGFRHKHGHFIALFSPLRKDRETMRWNPFNLLNKDSDELISDIDLIVENLITYEDDKDSMWLSEARGLTKGLILWLMDSGRPFSIGKLMMFIKGTPNFIEELTKIRDESINEDGTININDQAYTNINNFLNKAPKEQSGVKSMITAKLNLWDDPIVRAATATSDFDFRDIRKKKMTIYLGIPFNQLKRLAPLMNLFIQLFLKHMTKQLPGRDEPYKVLGVLDEFCALGRMEVLKDGFGFLAGYNIHLMAIIQNVGQFYDHYVSRDKADVFFQNTDYKIAYRQNTKTDKEFVSEMCGMRAVKNKTISFQGGILGQKQSGGSHSHMSKPLISPDQVGRFNPKYGIAVFNGQPAIKFKKIVYYKDKRFKDRVLPPVIIPKLDLLSNQLKIAKPLKKTGIYDEEEQQENVRKAKKMIPDLLDVMHSLDNHKDEKRKSIIESHLVDELEID